VSDLVDLLRATLTGVPEILAGVTELPAGRGVAVRVLGHTSKAVQAAVHAAWECARLVLVGAPAPNLRKA
jgi:urease accessory protein